MDARNARLEQQDGADRAGVCYFVNGYNLHTIDHNKGKSNMNRGVSIKSFSYTDTDGDFYGLLAKIIELDYPIYPNLHVVLFNCK